MAISGMVVESVERAVIAGADPNQLPFPPFPQPGYYYEHPRKEQAVEVFGNILI